MQNKIDIICDVSIKLTHQWVYAKSMGLDHPDCWIYSEYPDLYREDMPVTFDIVMKKALQLDVQQAVSLLESISAGLYQLCTEEGWFVKG